MQELWEMYSVPFHRPADPHLQSREAKGCLKSSENELQLVKLCGEVHLAAPAELLAGLKQTVRRPTQGH